ncbi:MAG TPA: hypothetical protein VMY98_09430 [Anaerolineae bacterium]|nr:hypothetical protein [Anaerolineae bacterium]
MEAQDFSIEQPMAQSQTDIDVLYQRSLLNFQDGKWQDAIGGFEEVLRLVPDHAEARAFLEEALMKASLDEHKPKPKRFRFEGRVKRVAQIAAVVCLVAAMIAAGYWAYDRVIGPRRAMQAEEARRAQLLEQAYTSMEERDYASAEKAFRELLTADPTHQKAKEGLAEIEKQVALAESYALAQAAIAREDWHEAQRILDSIAATDPSYRDVRDKQASVQEQQQLAQEFDQAEQAYDAAEWQQAIAAYEAVQDLDSTYNKQTVTERLFESYINQGMHLVESTGGESEAVHEAQKLYSKSLVMRPLDAQALREMALADKYLAAQSLLSAGDTEGATAELQWVYQTEPGYAAGNAAALLESAGGMEETATQPVETPPAETATSDLPVRPLPQGTFEEQYEYLIAQGDDAMATGGYAEAGELYIQAASIAVHGGTEAALWLFDAYSKAGSASARSGDYETAVERAKTAVDIMAQSAIAIPSSAYAGYVEQGDKYADSGDYQSALATYEMALRALGQKHDTAGSCGDWSLLPCGG